MVPERCADASDLSDGCSHRLYRLYRLWGRHAGELSAAQRQFRQPVGQNVEKAVKAVVPVPPAPKIIGRVWTAPRCSPPAARSGIASGAAGPTVPCWPSSCSTQAVPTSTSTIPASAGASGSPRRLEYGGPEVVNLYAFLAADPAELRRAGYPVGPDNDQQITEAVHESSRVVAAWGVHSARLGRPKGGPRVVEPPRGDAVLPSRHQQRTSGAPAAAPLELRAAALRGVRAPSFVK